MIEKIQKIKAVVESVLRDDPRTRNSDTWLIFETLRAMGFKVYIDFKQLKDMPSLETISRSRRYIQNEEGNYLSDKGVEEQRQELEKLNRKAWGKGHLV